MQDQNNLYTFLKKNAAYSHSGIASSKIDSEFSVNMAYQERNLGTTDFHSKFGGDVPEIKLFQDNNDLYPNQSQMLFSNNSIYTFGRGQQGGRGPEEMLRPTNQDRMRQDWKQSDSRSVKSSISRSSQASKNFESARVEASECLQNLSRDIHAEITSIDKKMQNFNNGLLRSLTDHFKSVREQVNRMVDAIVKESERLIFEFRRSQEQRMTGELMQIKAQLQKEYLKVEVMRGEINRQNWRKAAGEIISTELEQRVYNLIERSEGFDMRGLPWAEKTNYHLKEVEKHLRECLKLQ